MTIFILHGGETTTETPSNTAFWSIMASHLPTGGTWLGVYFASLEDTATKKFNHDVAKIHTAAPHPVTCVKATAENFETQIGQADVIYFAGGSTIGLMNQMNTWPQAKTWLQSAKVVAGSSAGMNLLGNLFLTKKGEHGHGLGLLPYNMIVHHTAPAYAIGHLANPLPLPTLALHETQFCVIEI